MKLLQIIVKEQKLLVIKLNVRLLKVMIVLQDSQFGSLQIQLVI